MTPDRLLDHFDRISDAPDAIPRLRRFILDLAVRGKLVEQEPSDEPVFELLKRMGAAKSDAVPFQIPSCWQWVRAGEIAECRLGKMLDKAKNKGTPRRYLRNVNVRWFNFDLSDVFEMPYEDSELDEFSIHSGDVLICEGGEPGRAAVWDEREAGLYFQKAIHRVRFPKGFNPHYFVSVLRVSAESGRLAAYFTGVGIKHFTGKGLSSFLIPLPPLTEQHRIVAKVDELMALCDRLETAQAERESKRDKLAAASLHRLNNGADPDQFREHARFHLRHLPRVTTRAEHIQQLRQTILNLAVRGKLVPQDLRDEAVGELLTRISAEQTALSKEGLLKNRVISSDLQNGEDPHEVPSHWRWVRLGELISFGPQNGISPKETKNDKTPKALTLTATTSGFFDPAHYKHVDLTEADCKKYWLSTGDVLFQRGNTREYVGIAAVFDGPERTFVFPDLMIRVRFSNSLDLRYIHTTLISPPLRNYFSRQATGASSTMPKISQGILLNAPIPVPPLAEQHRIVARVDELRGLCDQLEAQLTATQTESRRLLEAVLHEVLTPGVKMFRDPDVPRINI